MLLLINPLRKINITRKMYIIKLKSSVIISTIALSLGIAKNVVTPTTTQASNWHKGTPKVLRGTWRKTNYIH